MSQITTSLPQPAGRLAPARTPARAGAAARGRSTRILFVLVPLMVIGAAAWPLSGLVGAVGDAVDPEIGIVEPRSFNVVLKEKGELKAAKSTDIISEVEGRSTIISLIPEGTKVEEGDLLVELASDQIDDRIRQEELKESNALTAYEAAKAELDIQRDKNKSDIRKAQLEIELKRLELEKYEKGEWAQKLRDAEIAIEQAETLLRRRKEDFEAAKKLREREFITKTEFEEDEFNYEKAQWDLEKAINAKKVLEQYTHVAELRRRQSDLEEAVKEAERVRKNAEAEEIKKVRNVEGKKTELELIRDQLAKLRAQKEKSRIYAPNPGLVVYNVPGGRFWSSDGSGQIKEGATVHERQVLISLPDTSQMLAIVRVHEAKTDKLAIGQPATLTIEGLPGRVFTGKVTKIAPLADTENRWLNPDLKEYETEITLDPTDAALKPGVTAYVEILVKGIEDKLAVPVQSIYTKGKQRYVFRKDGRDVEAAPIDVGAVGAVWAEITGGLDAGDEILLAFADEHKQLVADPDLEDAASNGADGPWPDVRRRGKERADSDRSNRRPKAQRTTVTKTSTSTAEGSSAGTD